jgi:hypothetical protein
MVKMPRAPKIKTVNLVSHPRYGSEPKPSGYNFSEAQIRADYWRYKSDRLFHETAIPANPNNQNFSVFPRKYYVDILRTCRSCHRSFIFFAREQRYWYETLRFFIDADCVLCPVCRREARSTQRRLRRYSDLYMKTSPSRKELMFLVDDAIHLLEKGVLKNLTKIGKLKNLALKNIPEYPNLQALRAALATARESMSTT